MFTSATSLDGFIARQDGSFDWLSKYADQDAVEAYKAFIAGIDVIVIGRGTFETVMSFPDWPYDLPVVVLSRSLERIPPDLAEKVSVSSLRPNELLKESKRCGLSFSLCRWRQSDTEFSGRRSHRRIDRGSGSSAHRRRDPSVWLPQPAILSLSIRKTASYPNGLVRSYYKRPGREPRET